MFEARYRFWVTITVMVVAVAEVLDMTIVNVALPHMMASLGATSNQITWVLTAYIVSAAVFMPLTGFLSSRFGQKRLLLANIAGFCLASMLCGMAQTLPQMVIFRLCQGAFGAALVPLSQTILRQIYPPELQGRAMAIWGVGIMAGPILGPTLGGYITDSLNWRWVFYINVPICIFGWLASQQLVKETPKQQNALDLPSALFLILGVGGMQIFIDRGHDEGWLTSYPMVLLLGFWVMMLLCFVVRCLQHPDRAVVKLSLFADRNFAVACVLITAFGLSLFGSMAIAPSLLEHLLGYPPKIAGLLIAPQAIAGAFGMMTVAKVIGKVDDRKVVGLGVLLAAAGAYFRSLASLNLSGWQFVWPGIIQGFGTGLFFVPLANLAFATLSKEQTAEAAGLFSFFRNLGSSIGISTVATYLANTSQQSWQHLGSNIRPANPTLQRWLDLQGLSIDSTATVARLGHEILVQAQMLAHVYTFRLIAVVTILLLPCLLLLQQQAKEKNEHG